MKEETIQQIIRDEGLRYKAYTCTALKVTIGVGRNLEDNGLSHEEVMFLLNNDLERCADEVEKNLPWFPHLKDQRAAVIINMTFNLGITRLLQFKRMLAAVEKGDYLTASKEMLDSKWARQVPKRAERLALQMTSGQWIDSVA